MKDQVLILKCTAYDYVPKDAPPGTPRKRGGEVTYLTGNLVEEPYGTNKAAGVEVVSMRADYVVYEQVHRHLPGYFDVVYGQSMAKDSNGYEIVALRMLAAQYVDDAVIGPVEPPKVSQNGVATPVSPVGVAK
jgi:hypothetical protein